MLSSVVALINIFIKFIQIGDFLLKCYAPVEKVCLSFGHLSLRLICNRRWTEIIVWEIIEFISLHLNENLIVNHPSTGTEWWLFHSRVERTKARRPDKFDVLYCIIN